jgi:type IV secretory pathway VirB2 component (pilin)
MKHLALKIADTPIEAPPGIPTGGFTNSPVGNTILANLINTAFVIGTLFALLNIIWGGINWITSQGDKEKLNLARRRILFSIVGLVIITLAVLIVNFFLTFFGRPFGK